MAGQVEKPKMYTSGSSYRSRVRVRVIDAVTPTFGWRQARTWLPHAIGSHTAAVQLRCVARDAIRHRALERWDGVVCARWLSDTHWDNGGRVHAHSVAAACGRRRPSTVAHAQGLFALPTVLTHRQKPSVSFVSALG